MFPEAHVTPRGSRPGEARADRRSVVVDPPLSCATVLQTLTLPGRCWPPAPHIMRTHLLSVLVGITIAGGTARAQTPTGQDGGSSDAGQVYTLAVSSLPQTASAPILEIDAVVQDNGAIFAKGPGAVFVTVRGPSDGGGGALPLPDGGIDQSVNGPLI